MFLKTYSKLWRLSKFKKRDGLQELGMQVMNYDFSVPSFSSLDQNVRRVKSVCNKDRYYVKNSNIDPEKIKKPKHIDKKLIRTLG